MRVAITVLTLLLPASALAQPHEQVAPANDPSWNSTDYYWNKQDDAGSPLYDVSAWQLNLERVANWGLTTNQVERAGICRLSSFAVDSAGNPDWTSNYGVPLDCALDANWTKDTSASADWTPFDPQNADVWEATLYQPKDPADPWYQSQIAAADDLAAFVITSDGPDWTNDYGAGYPDLSDAAVPFRPLSPSMLVARSSSSQQ